MTAGSIIIGYLHRNGVKFKACKKDDCMMIQSLEVNGNLTPEGVYAYAVHADNSVDVFGTIGFMSDKCLMKKEKELLEEFGYTIRSMRP